ncbi:MAG: peptidase domain-containing ABC transporter [Woeseiaceae bacterium]
MNSARADDAIRGVQPRNSAFERLNFSCRARLPVILQNEISECALVCIAMVTSFYGYRTSLTELRRRFNVSITGSSVASIITICDSLDMSARSLRLDMHELRQLRKPAILHWRLDHFVVLKAVKRKGIAIHDPACGKRLIHWADVSRFFTGIAVELTPSEAFEKKEAVERVRLWDLWTRSRGLGATLLKIVALSAALQLLALLSPLINQLVVDEAIAKNDSDFLVAILIGFGLLLLSRTAIEFMRSTIGMYLGQMLSFQLRSNLLRHLFSLPADFFEKRHVGDITSRLGSIAPVQDLISSAVITILLDGLLGITTFAVMFLYSTELALMVVSITVLALITRLASFPYVRRLTEEKIHADADLQSVLLESIRAIRAVKLFGRESQRHTFWQNAFIDSSNVGIRIKKFGITAGAGSTLLFGSLDLAVFYVGAQSVIGGTLTLGMFFAFQSYRSQFSGRMAALIEQYFAFKTVGIHLERLTDIVHTDPEEPNAVEQTVSTGLKGKIEVRNARFRYGEDQPWVLESVNLTVEAGERVAFVGPSGGGKTTLLKVLLGLHPLNEGEVVYDDIPLRARGMHNVRRQVGVVMQDDRLLSGTLAENICFFDEAPDFEKITEASKTANILSEIERMPMGFHTLVGDMGSALSGGQKQRLLLARALYKEPIVLFLDEGTANLDEASESRVLASISAMNITQIIVAHRPAAIHACNRIISVCDGSLVEAAKL